jgi:hypothetical protein
MTDETPQEAVSEEKAAPASAAPQEQPSPDYVSKADLKAFGTALVEEIVPRLKQSQKDTIRDRVASEVGDATSEFDAVVAALAPYLPENFDVSDIKRQQFIDKLMAQPSSPPEPEPDAPSQAAAPEPASPPPGRETEIAQILEEHGLSGNEPELTEYAEANQGKPWYLVGQGFVDLAKNIAARSAGDSAGVAVPQGQVSNPDLAAEFRKELSEAKEKGRYGMNTLRALKAKYADLGLSDEEMDISTTDSIQTRGYLYRSESPYSQG